MRVDRDLICQLLKAIEAAPGPELRLMPDLSNDSGVQMYHTQLLIDGGYVTAQQLDRFRRPCALGLTLAGQELLDKLRCKPPSMKPILDRVLAESAVRLILG